MERKLNGNIYVVTEGCYSDYHICGIFSTLEKAQEAKEFYQADNIEDYVLDELPEHPAGCFCYWVRMDSKGEVVYVGRQDGTYACKREWAPAGDNLVYFNVWAKTEDHAVKIANERRLALLASGQWTTDYAEWRERWLKEGAP